MRDTPPRCDCPGHRRCGFGPRFSLDIAVAWAFNQRDEDTRAVGHGTGAEA